MLYHVEFAINSIVAESIGRSPIELVCGEQVRLPVDTIFGHQSGRSTAVNSVQNIYQLVQDANYHLKRAQEY